MRNLLALVAFSLCCFSLCAEEEANTDVAQIEEENLVAGPVFLMSRTEGIPDGHLDTDCDHYLQGYIQALLDMHYYEYQVIVVVHDGTVYLSNLPKNDLISSSIISFVEDIQGVCTVEVKVETCEEEIRDTVCKQPRVDGIWFPQSTVLFAPLVADPRETVYSAAYRYGDHVIGKQAAAISLGDDFPVFRWRNVFMWQGDLQIGIGAAVWAVFNFEDVPHRNHQVSELVNADYFLSIPLSYAFDRWSFRMRIYHISSHLGDEFLVDHPDFLEKRVNPSFEAIDLFASYQASRHLRLYAGGGFILHSDQTFPMKRLYVEYGAELRVWGSKLSYHRLYGTPFFAVHCENWQVRDWGFDVTFKMGYEFSKLEGVGRKMRLYVDYHHGYSYEGQFFKKKTDYGELGFSWGF